MKFEGGAREMTKVGVAAFITLWITLRINTWGNDTYANTEILEIWRITVRLVQYMNTDIYYYLAHQVTALLQSPRKYPCWPSFVYTWTFTVKGQLFFVQTGSLLNFLFALHFTPRPLHEKKAVFLLYLCPSKGSKILIQCSAFKESLVKKGALSVNNRQYLNWISKKMLL